MYEPYNEETASVEDRVAWALCQIIDDDAPVRWTRYRFVAECIANNAELMSNLRKKAKVEEQSHVIDAGLLEIIRQTIEQKENEALNKGIEEVITLLNGIDKCEVDATEGWWETSDGAKFGKIILNKINKLKEV